jgi:hypothetical protein
MSEKPVVRLMPELARYRLEVTVNLATGTTPEKDLLFLTPLDGAHGLPAGAFHRVPPQK